MRKCAKNPGESARRYLLAKREKYKQNNYVIHVIMAAHCHKVQLRRPDDRVNLDDIKKSVAMKKTHLNIFRYAIGRGVGL